MSLVPLSNLVTTLIVLNLSEKSLDRIKHKFSLQIKGIDTGEMADLRVALIRSTAFPMSIPLESMCGQIIPLSARSGNHDKFVQTR